VIDEAELPAEILEVREYRAAGREIAQRKDLTQRQKLEGFARLAEIARQKAELPQLCQGSVWAEYELWMHGPPPDSPDPVERACRGLVREGYIRCPSCRRGLPGEADFARWEQLRLEAVRWYSIREKAVQ
jgi:hypothetical protein